MTKKRKIKTPGIYLDVNGTYYLKYQNKTYRGFKSVQEAEIYKASLRLHKSDIQFVKLSVVIESYLQDLKSRMNAQEITYGTYDKKRSILKHYISDDLGDYKLNKLTPTILRNYRNSLIPLKLSSYQKNYALQTLNTVLNYARKYYGFKEDLSIYLEKFPKTSEEKKKDKDRLSYIWTESDFKRFISGMDDEYKLIFTLMFNHGLRLGEAQALRYCDVDFKNKTIDINGSITRKTQKGTYERKSTKTDSSERIIFIGNTISIILKLEKANKSFYGFNNEWFMCGNKHPLTAKQVQRKRELHIKKAKLPPVTNHEMRHMFVTNAWSEVPTPALSEYIGHKNVAVTLNVYSHLAEADRKKMVDYIKKRK